MPYLVDANKLLRKTLQHHKTNTRKHKEQYLKLKKKCCRINATKVEVVPETNTSPVTNIGYYVHTQNQKILFRLRAKGKKPPQKAFWEAEEQRHHFTFQPALPSNQKHWQNELKGKTLKTYYEPPMNLQMSDTTYAAITSPKKIFDTLTEQVSRQLHITKINYSQTVLILRGTINQSTQPRERTNAEVSTTLVHCYKSSSN